MNCESVEIALTVIARAKCNEARSNPEKRMISDWIASDASRPRNNGGVDRIASDASRPRNDGGVDWIASAFHASR